MPETPDTAPDVGKKSASMVALPPVASTGLNHSNYLKEVRQHATAPTNCWLGTRHIQGRYGPARALTLELIRAEFYPLVRIDRVDPDHGALGRLYGLFFLKSASYVRDLTNAVSDGLQLLLVVPALPLANCPVRQVNAPPCTECPAWMRCSTETVPFARATPIKIDSYHYDKTCNGASHWTKAGETLRRISYHRVAGPTIDLCAADLALIPQFAHLAT